VALKRELTDRPIVIRRIFPITSGTSLAQLIKICKTIASFQESRVKLEMKNHGEMIMEIVENAIGGHRIVTENAGIEGIEIGLIAKTMNFQAKGRK